ncbi:MAG: hypothetical protein KDI30_03995 [Pseudomonadales bacterium]|nr:hypothetical protein [Pseudomonadales bacterium]
MIGSALDTSRYQWRKVNDEEGASHFIHHGVMILTRLPDKLAVLEQ